MSLSLRDGLRQRGHQTHLFTSRAQSHPLPLLADSSCYGSFGPQRRALLVANPSARRQLARVVKEFRPDVVHVRMFLTQLSPLILPVLRDIPCVLHVVTYEMICPRGTKRLPNGDACRVRSGMACLKSRCVSPIKLMEHKVQQRMMGDLSVFDRIVANSGWTRRRLLADGVRCEESVSNGVPLRPRRPPLSGPPTIAYAGRLVAEKGVEMLLHVIHNVRERCPGATLLIAGEGPLEARLKALAGGLNLNGAVQFLGHRSRDQLEQVLASAWVQAVPSLWEEPFGIVAAEAMMRGTAVAASDHGGLAEQVISDGPDRTGTLLPAGDVEAWTSALLELLHDQPLCERLGAAGAVRARQSFSEARFLEGFEWIYAKVAAPIASISY